MRLLAEQVINIVGKNGQTRLFLYPARNLFLASGNQLGIDKRSGSRKLAVNTHCAPAHARRGLVARVDSGGDAGIDKYLAHLAV